MIFGSKAIGTISIMGGVPAVLSKFCWSLCRLTVFSQESLCQLNEYIHFDVVEFSDHAPARNALADRFLGGWVLFLDTDHEFEPDLLTRLVEKLKTPGVDVVTGLYRFKTPPYSPVLFRWGENENLQPIACWSPKDVELFEIGSAGAGCLLVRRSVFEAIGEGPFDRIHPYSEDHSFFLRLKRLGIKAYCAPKVECWHLQPRPISENDEDYGDHVISEPMIVGAFACQY